MNVRLSKVTLTPADSRTSVGGITGVLASRVETSGIPVSAGIIEKSDHGRRRVPLQKIVQLWTAAFPMHRDNDSNKATVGKIQCDRWYRGLCIWLSNHNDSSDSGKLDGCVNHASVSSNLSAGGIRRIF